MVRRGIMVLALSGVVAVAAQPAVAAPSAEEQSKQHFEAGKRYYRMADFDKAIAEWRKGYELAGDPVFLFNIGQAYRQQKDWEQAVYFYESFLREAPNAANKDEVKGHIETGRAELAKAAQDPPAGEVKQPAEPPPDPPSGSPLAGPPPARPRITFDAGAGLFVVHPYEEHAFEFATDSPGIRIGVGVTLVAGIGLELAGRFMPSVAADPDWTSASYYDLSFGVRWRPAVPWPVHPYAQLDLILYSATDTTWGDGETDFRSGVGFGLRGGALYAITPAFGVGLALTYSRTEQVDDGNWTVAWLGAEVQAAYTF